MERWAPDSLWAITAPCPSGHLPGSQLAVPFPHSFSCTWETPKQGAEGLTLCFAFSSALSAGLYSGVMVLTNGNERPGPQDWDFVCLLIQVDCKNHWADFKLLIQFL